MREHTFPGSAATWAPAQTVLRARMAALARSAQTPGAQISAAASGGFLGKFGGQARELVEARLAKGERIGDVEAEVARVASVLLRMHMTDLAHHPRKPRQPKGAKGAKAQVKPPDPPDAQAEKSRLALGSYEATANPLPRSRYVLQAQPPTPTASPAAASHSYRARAAGSTA